MTYEYNCKLERVVDGDTVDIIIDLGFKISQRMRVRLTGINTPEMNTPEGVIARTRVVDWFNMTFSPIIATQKDKADKYGRYLGTFYDQGTWSTSLNDTLLDEGLAVRYT